MFFIVINIIIVGYYDSLNCLKVVVLIVILDSCVLVRKLWDLFYYFSVWFVCWVGSCILSLFLELVNLF